VLSSVSARTLVVLSALALLSVHPPVGRPKIQPVAATGPVSLAAVAFPRVAQMQERMQLLAVAAPPGQIGRAPTWVLQPATLAARAPAPTRRSLA